MHRKVRWGISNPPLCGTPFNRGHPLSRGLIGLFSPHTTLGQNASTTQSKWDNLAKPMAPATFVGCYMNTIDRFGNAIYLTKSSNLARVDWGNDNIFDFAGNDFTLSLWIQPMSGFDAFYSIISRTSSVGSGWSIYRDDNSGPNQYKLAFLGWNGGSVTVSSHVDSTLTNGAWYHILCQIKGGYSQFWQNGVKCSENLATGTIGSSTNSLYFGKHYNDLTGYCFQGYMGPVKIWKRALNENEVRTEYENPYEVFNYPKVQQGQDQPIQKWSRGRVQGDFIFHRQDRRMVA